MADKKSDPKTVGDLLSESGAAGGVFGLLIGGPLVAGKMAEWENTLCEDCLHGTVEKHQRGNRLGPLCDYSGLVIFSGGPPWPGCRGFVLRESAPGPAKRAHEAAQAKMEAAMRTAKENAT